MTTTLSSNKLAPLTFKTVTNEPVQISGTDSGTTTSAVTIQKRPILIDGGGSDSIIKKPILITKDESDFIKMDLLKEDTAGTESITENAAGTESTTENTHDGNPFSDISDFLQSRNCWAPLNLPAATEQAENSDKTSGNKKKMLIAGGIAAGLFILFIVLRKKK